MKKYFYVIVCIFVVFVFSLFSVCIRQQTLITEQEAAINLVSAYQYMCNDVLSSESSVPKATATMHLLQLESCIGSFKNENGKLLQEIIHLVSLLPPDSEAFNSLSDEIDSLNVYFGMFEKQVSVSLDREGAVALIKKLHTYF